MKIMKRDITTTVRVSNDFTYYCIYISAECKMCIPLV